MRIVTIVTALVVLALTPASGQTPKRGGILNAMQAEDLPAGFSIHETATIMGLRPVMPCYSNLVLFDPLKPRETPETIIPELAEKWSWVRNSTDYCNPDVDRLIDLQSQELDPKKRLALVLDIQRRLEDDVAKPMPGWRSAYFARWPYVRNLVPHAPVYNFARMQEVWLDR